MEYVLRSSLMYESLKYSRFILMKVVLGFCRKGEIRFIALKRLDQIKIMKNFPKIIVYFR